MFGASVSGVFLLLIGGVNLAILGGILRVFLRMRRGEYDEAELEEQLNNRGAMNRLFRGVMRGIRRPFHIYPVGVLFGFGFDTVSEIALLALAGTPRRWPVCRGTPSSPCRCSSPPACRCWTPPTGPS